VHPREVQELVEMFAETHRRLSSFDKRLLIIEGQLKLLPIIEKGIGHISAGLRLTAAEFLLVSERLHFMSDRSVALETAFAGLKAAIEDKVLADLQQTKNNVADLTVQIQQLRDQIANAPAADADLVGAADRVVAAANAETQRLNDLEAQLNPPPAPTGGDGGSVPAPAPSV
jgi:chromosome segregation ATPase